MQANSKNTRCGGGKKVKRLKCKNEDCMCTLPGLYRMEERLCTGTIIYSLSAVPPTDRLDSAVTSGDMFIAVISCMAPAKPQA
jgi:hypothetical protein